MYQHPFARAASAVGAYPENSEIGKRRLLETYPATGKLPISTRVPAAKSEPIQRVMCEKFHKRAPHAMVIEDSGLTLMLNGQEEGATVPEYDRGALVDGTVSFTNPGNITKVEVRIEGHVMVQENGGAGSSEMPVLSELLVFWDAPNRLGGYSNGSASGEFAPQPGSCPRTISFRTVLPTQYTDADGSSCPLPPSFSDTLPGVPGFRCAAQYSISVYITRVRDVRVKIIRAQWKRNTVFRTSIEYRPRTRPSQPPPFPANSKDPSLGPITRFSETIGSHCPSVKPLRTTLYLPNSQITSLSSPIPFFLRVSGPKWIIDVYSRPPLSSFLPKAGRDDFPTICSLIGHVINDNFQGTTLARVFSFPGTHSDSSWNMLGNEKDWLRCGDVQEKGKKTRCTPPSTGVRLALVREVSVHARRSLGHDTQPEPSNEFDVYSDAFSDSCSFLDTDGSRVTGSHMHKRTVLGEGVMYTASVSRGSITWAGEIRIDPQLGVRTGGFSIGRLEVKDMLMVTVREPRQDASSGKQREFQQIIPIQLTTDSYKEGYSSNN